MNTGTSDSNPDDNDPIPPLSSKEKKLRHWYFTAKRLEENGQTEEALDYFKRIYEVDSSYEDVAEIVEKSYE